MLLSAVEAADFPTATYDFFYLPIDFRNKCNLGYCFINFIQHDSAVQCSGALAGLQEHNYPWRF